MFRPNITVKPPSDSMPAMISVVVVSSTSRSSSSLAVHLGQAELRDQVLAGIPAALGDDPPRSRVIQL